MAIQSKRFTLSSAAKVIDEIVQFAKDKNTPVIVCDCEGMRKKYQGYKLEGSMLRLFYADLDDDANSFETQIEEAVFTRRKSPIMSSLSGSDVDGESFRVTAKAPSLSALDEECLCGDECCCD